MSHKNIIQGNFTEELSSRYLTYALSTIMSRALPDVRDGLKPVHRRLLYAMHMLRLDPDKGYKKCARVVGDVIGKYHPHGDQSVYDAMVRLAQDFSVRYPLVDGQGNFGSIDGDGPAAMRYTEARLTEVARWMMKDLASGTVDFTSTYDESDQEPMVMPGCFPNLLANGSSGIAVGLSTSIPPHNVGELCDAMTGLLKKPDLPESAMLNYIQGPDFPTGGVLIETRQSIGESYASGKGSFRLRARWETEDLGRGMYQIVITETPYQVQKSKIVEKIADLMHERKLPWLADVRDESAETTRLVLEPKTRNIEASALMEALYRQTELEVRVSLNMYVIDGQKPAMLSLKEALQAFLAHRRVVLLRKSGWRLGKIADRLHILDAYRVVYLNIDEVIEIIKNNDHPAPIMMERFKIDDVQAEAILDMRLRRLRKLEEMEIKQEYDALQAEQAELQAILNSEEQQTKELLAEVKSIKTTFGDARRTSVEEAPEAVVVPLEAHVEKEPMTVLLSTKGWVKALKGHMAEDAEVKYKEGDEEYFRLLVQSTDSLCLMSTQGRAFMLPVNKLPAGRGFGEPVRLMVELAAEEEVCTLFKWQEEKYLVATKKGVGFVVEGQSLNSQTRTGKQIVNLGKGDALLACVPLAPNGSAGTHVAILGATEKILAFPLAEVPTLARGKGVKLAGLKGENLLDICVFHENAGFGLLSDSGKRKQSFPDFSLWLGKRAQVGKAIPHGFKNGCSFFVPEHVVKEKVAEKRGRVEELLNEITAPKEQEAEQVDNVREDASANSAAARKRQLDFLLGEESED